MWRSHECCRATNVAMPRMSKGRMFSTNAGGECGGATDVAEQRMSATNVQRTNVAEQRGSSTFNRLSEQTIAQRLIRRIDHEVIDRRAIDPKDKKKEQTEVRSLFLT